MTSVKMVRNGEYKSSFNIFKAETKCAMRIIDKYTGKRSKVYKYIGHGEILVEIIFCTLNLNNIFDPRPF